MLRFVGCYLLGLAFTYVVSALWYRFFFTDKVEFFDPVPHVVGLMVWPIYLASITVHTVTIGMILLCFFVANAWRRLAGWPAR